MFGTQQNEGILVYNYNIEKVILINNFTTSQMRTALPSILVKYYCN